MAVFLVSLQQELQFRINLGQFINAEDEKDACLVAFVTGLWHSSF
jgi:hypothetical protein